MTEAWKQVEGFDGFYEVSNLGRVRSVGGECGNVVRKPRVLSQSTTKDGYMKVRLNRNGTDRTCRVHRLVAEAFLPNPCNLDTVNHKDGDKLNNHVDNLEWMNRSGQLTHAYNLGLKSPVTGAENAQAKLTDEAVREIRRTYVRGSREFGTVALGRRYEVTNRVIGLVVRGISYREV